MEKRLNCLARCVTDLFSILRSGPVIYVIEELLQISPLLYGYHNPGRLLFPVPSVKNI